MTWKQFVRSVEASQRRSHREHVRRQRQQLQQAVASARATARSQKQWEKEQKWLRQSSEADQFEHYMDALVSLHTDWSEPFDWHAMLQTPPPVAPEHDVTSQVAARAALTNFQPGLFKRIFGSTKTQRAQLEAELARAISADQAAYDAAMARFQQDRQVWETCTRLAPSVLRLELAACGAALRHAHSFEDIEMFGTSVELASLDGDAATLSVLIKNDEIVPEKEIKMTASGKQSIKDIPTGRYWTVFHEHVCSCALRVALETFAVLPVRRAIVNIARVTVDPSTGHRIRPTIFAIHAAREDFERLNLDAIEPAAAMKHFPHRIAFKKTTGFGTVDPITSKDQWASS